MNALILYMVESGTYIKRCKGIERAILAAVEAIRLQGFKRFEVDVSDKEVNIFVNGLQIIGSKPLELNPKPQKQSGWNPLGRPPKDDWWLFKDNSFTLNKSKRGHAVVFLDENDSVLQTASMETEMKATAAQKGIAKIADVFELWTSQHEIPLNTDSVVLGIVEHDNGPIISRVRRKIL